MRMKRTAAGLALFLVAACGSGEGNSTQPTGDEASKLDNIAAKADAAAETIDTSPDSLVPEEGAVAAADAANNNVAATPPAADNSTTGDAAAPR